MSGKRMNNEVLKYGGLFRCCIETWDTIIEQNSEEYVDGAVLPCLYCDSVMIRKDGEWGWKRD